MTLRLPVLIHTVQSESWVWREREKVEEDKTEVEEQRERLEKDRHALIEAAKKLDREVGVACWGEL